MVKIPEWWIETTLWEVVEVKSWSTPSTKEESFWDWNISWITPKDLSTYNKRFIDSWEKNITELWLRKSSAQLLPKNTVLFSSRAPIWYVAITNKELTTNQWFKNLICDEKNSHFMFFYYWLKCKKDFIEWLASWSTFSEISWTWMKNLPIILPSLPEQKAIAGVLSSFDDKIELLRAENDTLEEMGQTLFKERFGKYKVWDKLPDGWRVGKIWEIVSVNKRWITPEYNDNKDIMVISQKSIRNSIIDLNEVYWHDSSKKYDEELNLQFMDTLINSMWTWTLWRISPYILSLPATLHSCVTLLRSNNNIINPYYLYLLIKSLENIITDMWTWSTGQTSLKNSDLWNLEIIIPSKIITDNFEEIIKPLYKRISLNLEGIKSLSDTRDQLLPKLMSWEVRVEF